MPGQDDMLDSEGSGAIVQPLDWNHDGSDISAGGLEMTRTATPEERAALAARLEILGVDALQSTYRIKRMADERGFRLRGKLTADVVLACTADEQISLPLARL